MGRAVDVRSERQLHPRRAGRQFQRL